MAASGRDRADGGRTGWRFGRALAGRRLRRLMVGGSIGAALAIAAPTLAFADLQLATLACSDGSQFDVQVDTDTLNMLTNAVTSINDENLGLSCSITVQPVVVSPLAMGISTFASNSTSIYSVGGGLNDAGVHFSFSAHVDPDTGAMKGHAVIQPANNQPKLEGDVFCYMNFGTTRFSVVGINVNEPDGTIAPVIFQQHDNGTPSSTVPSYWQIDQGQTDCATFQGDQNQVVHGNVVVRP